MRCLLLILLILKFENVLSQGNPLDKNPIQDFRFSDTTINKFHFVFKELGYDEFELLRLKSFNHDLVLGDAETLVMKKDSSLIIKLQNGRYDTLKSHRDPGGYHESYEIIGYWKVYGNECLMAGQSKLPDHCGEFWC